MNREKAAEIHRYLQGQKHTSQVKSMVELITMTREKCLDNLETADNAETRGRSKFCKELLKILSE